MLFKSFKYFLFLFFLSISPYEAMSQYHPTENGVYAKVETQKGNIWIELHYDKVPMTVANFIGLSEGMIENSFRKLGNPYYNGLAFHRVVPGRAVQGGCPSGDGYGNPGYRFKDEFVKDLKHDKAGVVSMANSGKNTNGSQFFITLGPESDLDGKYVVFGMVVMGQDIVGLLEIDDKIDTIKIFRIGAKAESFDIASSFPAKARKKT